MKLKLTSGILPHTLLDKVIDAVKRLAEKYPNAQYEKPCSRICEYAAGTVKNGPQIEGCIVGQAIREVAPGYFPLIRYSRSTVDDLFNCLDKQEEARWLNSVQIYQDTGYTWGQAVDRANQKIKQ